MYIKYHKLKIMLVCTGPNSLWSVGTFPIGYHLNCRMKVTTFLLPMVYGVQKTSAAFSVAETLCLGG